MQCVISGFSMQLPFIGMYRRREKPHQSHRHNTRTSLMIMYANFARLLVFSLNLDCAVLCGGVLEEGKGRIIDRGGAVRPDHWLLPLTDGVNFFWPRDKWRAVRVSSPRCGLIAIALQWFPLI